MNEKEINKSLVTLLLPTALVGIILFITFISIYSYIKRDIEHLNEARYIISDIRTNTERAVSKIFESIMLKELSAYDEGMEILFNIENKINGIEGLFNGDTKELFADYIKLTDELKFYYQLTKSGNVSSQTSSIKKIFIYTDDFKQHSFKLTYKLRKMQDNELLKLNLLIATSSLLLIMIVILNGIYIIPKKIIKPLKLYADSLKISEEKYRVVTDIIYDWEYWIDDTGKVAFMSKSAEEFTGYSINDFVSNISMFVDIVAPEDKERVMEHIQKIHTSEYKKNEIVELKFTIITKSGKRKYILHSCKKIYDKSGNYIGIRVSNRDINDKKSSEEKINLLIKALEASANAIVITDFQAIIQWANPAFEKLTGYKITDALNKKPKELVASGMQTQEFYNILWDTILKGDVWHGELINKKRDGSLYHEELTITPLKNISGEITHFIAVKQDVTERKKAEKELKRLNESLASKVETEVVKRLESQIRFKQIYDQSPIGILSLDKNMIIKECNNRASVIIGYKHEELIGKSILEISPEYQPDGLKSLSKSKELFKQVLLNSTINFEWVHIDNSANEIIIQVLLTQVNLMGKDEILVIWNDITELKKLQQEKNIQQALLIQQSKLAELGNMIGAIAHQWKQPLNTLGIIAQYLADVFNNDEIDKEQINELTNEMMNHVIFMSQTVDDFRNFYKPTKEMGLFNIKNETNSVIKLIKGHLDKLGVSVNLSIDENINFYGYTGEFKQVILNIINNAGDAFSNKAISNRKIDISLIDEADNIIISVQDNAGGIPNELLPDKIFEPFITTKGDKGTGIGLSLSKEIIVNRMNGNITAENLKDGALFTIYLKKS